MKTAAKEFIIIGIVVGFITLNQMKTQKPTTTMCVLCLIALSAEFSCFVPMRANLIPVLTDLHNAEKNPL